MNSRRSFLKWLGIGAVAAPVVASFAVEAEPVSAMAIRVKYRRDAEERYGCARDLLEAQREINKLRSAMLREYVREGSFVPYSPQGVHRHLTVQRPPGVTSHDLAAS